MGLNTSGPISLAGTTDGQSIALELGESATAVISLNDSAVRDLGGVASGAIVMPTNFYGASSGPSLSFGSAQSTGVTGVSGTATTYDQYRDRVVLSYGKYPSQGLYAKTGTISGNTITYAAETLIWNANSSPVANLGATYRANDEVTVIFFNESSNSNRGVVTTLNVNTSGIPTRGATSGFGAGTDSITMFGGNVVGFDSDNNNSFAVYKNNSNSGYGEMQVANAGFASITMYNEVVFHSASIDYCSTTFGINGAAVVVFIDANNSNKGKARVASMTNQPSFGNVALFSDAQTEFCTVVFAGSPHYKYVVIYQTSSDNNLKARVGSVSGTGISFGTEVTIDTNYITGFSMSASWNPDDKVVVISWEDRQSSPNAGMAVLGTISGTDITFSGLAAFESGNVNYTSQVYDPDTDQTLIAFADVDASSTLKVVTANVAT